MEKDFIIILFFFNLFNFFLCFYDKWCSMHQKRRIQEKTLFLFSFLGGSIGLLLGMYTFHHKTKKSLFKYGIPLLILFQFGIIILVFLWKN